MAESIVVFRSRHRNHFIKSNGLSVKFLNHLYRTDIPGEIAELRKRSEMPNPAITEIKPEQRVKVTIEKEAPAAEPAKGKAKGKATAPEDLDVPDAGKEKK